MNNQNKIWGSLIHLSFNMWEDWISPHRPFRGYRPYLRLDEPLWNEAVQSMADNGHNMVLIDLGDAVKYESHPEIAVRNAWSTQRLRDELKKIRALGMEPIPKLNFSAGHDIWLGDYSRMVSTDTYYGVCGDLIRETCQLFDKPRFFHLGMDEETLQTRYKHVVVRKNDAWWKDFYYLVDQTEKNGSKAWIWSDYMLWHYPEQFYKKMPKSVVQSNWYYRTQFTADSKRVKYYIDLSKAGYEQIPAGGYLTGPYFANYKSPELNIGGTVEFCKNHVDDKLLLGFLQTWWGPTIEETRDRMLGGIRLLGEAEKLHYRRS